VLDFHVRLVRPYPTQSGLQASSAAGLRHQAADSNADCDPWANTKSKVSDQKANRTSDRYAKRNSNAHEFIVSFVG
jgi:hypothetical protein